MFPDYVVITYLPIIVVAYYYILYVYSTLMSAIQLAIYYTCATDVLLSFNTYYLTINRLFRAS